MKKCDCGKSMFSFSRSATPQIWWSQIRSPDFGVWTTIISWLQMENRVPTFQTPRASKNGVFYIMDDSNTSRCIHPAVAPKTAADITGRASILSPQQKLHPSQTNFDNLETLVYHFFRQLWLVLGIKLMEINSNWFSRKKCLVGKSPSHPSRPFVGKKP